MSDNEIAPRVVDTAERIEQDGFDRDEIMEHRYTISDSGIVLEVEAVLTVGGPNIWVECLSGVVGGSWGMESHRCHVNSDEVEDYGREMAERMETRID